MEWISVRDKLPPKEDHFEANFVIAYHTIHGVGVAWIWKFEEDDGIIEELEEQTGDKYICSAQFIKSKKDGDDQIDIEEDIDIFENSPHFRNLGTISHWMSLPKFVGKHVR